MFRSLHLIDLRIKLIILVVIDSILKLNTHFSPKIEIQFYWWINIVFIEGVVHLSNVIFPTLILIFQLSCWVIRRSVLFLPEGEKRLSEGAKRLRIFFPRRKKQNTIEDSTTYVGKSKSNVGTILLRWTTIEDCYFSHFLVWSKIF